MQNPNNITVECDNYQTLKIHLDYRYVAISV